jgi:hypothetical protein
MDLTGFWKDRTHWYASWFPNFNEEAPPTDHVHAFPHWDWKTGDKVDIWSFSNADSVQLQVNGKLISKQQMPPFGCGCLFPRIPLLSSTFCWCCFVVAGSRFLRFFLFVAFAVYTSAALAGGVVAVLHNHLVWLERGR